MSLVPRDAGPSPWLTWGVALALSVGTSAVTTAFTVGGKSEALVYETRRNDAQDARLEALEKRANGTDVVLERISTELRNIREGVSDLRELLRGGTARR